MDTTPMDATASIPMDAQRLADNERVPMNLKKQGWKCQCMSSIRELGLLSALALVMAAVGAAHSSSSPAYHWHDSSQYSRVIVNATQGIETRPRDWFTKDKLVTDFAITNLAVIGQEKAEQEYEATRQLLESYGLAVGTYVSGTSVVPQAKETQWPWPRVPIEWMPATARYSGTWPNTPYRKLIDVTDPATRQALHEGIKRLWEQHPAPVRFIDNAAFKPPMGGRQPWADYCTNIAEIRALGESMGSLQIFNIGAHVEDLSDDETRELIQAVGTGGILLEMPWPKDAAQHPAALARASQRYRQLLDTGMGVILDPPGGAPSQDLVNWVRSWRKPTDHIYFGGAFFKGPPDMNLFGPGDGA